MMSPLALQFYSLASDQQRFVVIRLLWKALDVWEQYNSPGTRPTYQESVSGSIQELDTDLPREALETILAGTDISGIAERYREPIVALRDEDIQLPESAEFAYYAIYNAYRRYILLEPVEDKLLINQLLSSLPSEQAESAFCEALLAQSRTSG
ncbi:hypothetical protein [Massilia sp. BKSP1R2A-1]|uniref:hypothetical protein n=1 Tax=Massilia sp. BKSP1R2A-1 TaxID=3422595 RepID=UPI003D32A122